MRDERRTLAQTCVNPIQEVSGSAAASLLTGLEIDEFFVRTDTSGTSVLLTDALGSTVALTDAAGAVQTQYTYEPFGQAPATGAASSNSLQYTGRENDGTGLYYYRARYYHPGLQRFISEDPLGFAGGDTNHYAYARNNPMSFTDAMGLVVDLSRSSPELNEALALIRATKRGQELYELMEKDSRTCQIIALPGSRVAEEHVAGVAKTKPTLLEWIRWF